MCGVCTCPWPGISSGPTPVCRCRGGRVSGSCAGRAHLHRCARVLSTECVREAPAHTEQTHFAPRQFRVRGLATLLLSELRPVRPTDFKARAESAVTCKTGRGVGQTRPERLSLPPRTRKALTPTRESESCLSCTVDRARPLAGRDRVPAVALLPARDVVFGNPTWERAARCPRPFPHALEMKCAQCGAGGRPSANARSSPDPP